MRKAPLRCKNDLGGKEKGSYGVLLPKYLFESSLVSFFFSSHLGFSLQDLLKVNIYNCMIPEYRSLNVIMRIAGVTFT
jgi:hypothetical protein